MSELPNINGTNHQSDFKDRTQQTGRTVAKVLRHGAFHASAWLDPSYTPEIEDGAAGVPMRGKRRNCHQAAFAVPSATAPSLPLVFTATLALGGHSRRRRVLAPAAVWEVTLLRMHE